MFHKEGFKIIIVTMVIIAIITFLTEHFISAEWLKKVIMLSMLGIFVLILQFFRNPKRTTLIDEFQIIAPVDGKVVAIEEVFEKEYFKDNRRQVSIFMSPLNVHVTRYPVSGKVVFSKYHPGKYLVAWHPKSSEENEHTTVVVETAKIGKILYRQIAGALAKRIVNYADENATAIQGADAGFIKFGSRVDIFLPTDMEIKVSLNQKAVGGKTIIAQYNEKP